MASTIPRASFDNQLEHEESSLHQHPPNLNVTMSPAGSIASESSMDELSANGSARVARLRGSLGNLSLPGKETSLIRIKASADRPSAQRMLHTRSLSELFLEPRSSPRVKPEADETTDIKQPRRLEMDIEVPAQLANHGSFAWSSVPSGDNNNNHNNNNNDNDEGQETEPQPDEEPKPANRDTSGSLDSNQSLDEDELRPSSPEDLRHSVGEVVDTLFEIHAALKNRNMIGMKRTAASALAASNLCNVPQLQGPAMTTEERDEKLETLENARRMLECSVCQDVFTEATETDCCGQVYCKECIDRWISESGSCPMCRIPLTTSMLRPARHAQRMANEMIVQCPYCDEEMKKAVLASHLDDCDQAPAPPPLPLDEATRNLLLTNARVSHEALCAFLTMPMPPQAQTLQCYIRSRNGRYELYTQQGDELLAIAVRRRQMDMSVVFSIYSASQNGQMLESTDASTNPRRSRGNSLRERLGLGRHANQEEIPSLRHSSSGASEAASPRHSRRPVRSLSTDAAGSSRRDNNEEGQQIYGSLVGRLERNFVGSQYTAFSVPSEQAPRSSWTEIAAVQYAATFGKTPRQMRVALPPVERDNNSSSMEMDDGDMTAANVPMWHSNTANRSLQAQMGPLPSTSNSSDHAADTQPAPSNSNMTDALSFVNKPPVWIESLEAYCLDFGGRVAAASVKNFLLSSPDDMDKTLMLFGRTADRHVYSMDYSHPFSPLQAFAIALSSMDSHLVTFD